MKRLAWLVGVGLGVLCSAAPAAADEGAISSVAIQGVDPRVYLRALRPRPHALLELKRLPVDVSVAILEGNGERYLADRRAYPRHLKAAELEGLRAAETSALIEGALAAVAAKRHPRARALIEDWLEHDDARVRAAAAERYGEVGGRVTVLSALASDVDDSVRQGACLGLGKLRTVAGVEALVRLARDGRDVERQIIALRALGLAANAPAGRAHDPEEQQAAATAARVALAVMEPANEEVKAAHDEVVARLK